jgi:RHS repeat-associated protein
VTAAGSITYLPFGETRSGSVGIDQKFTGQRLDSTGLYYYGARYYDPAIGRFISADTIVPNSANPQSLNRYSYCLNNPLKYVDPSGHVVEFANEDVAMFCIEYGISSEYTDQLIQQWSELRCAWYELGQVADGLTDALENDPTVITIQWNDLPANYGGDTSGNIMSFNSNRTWITESLASTIGHEAFHQLIDLKGFTANSAYEEACAASYGSAIDKALNGVLPGLWDRVFNNPYDNMTKNSSDAWIGKYVNDRRWKNYGGEALWDHDTVYTSPGNGIWQKTIFNPSPKGGIAAYQRMKSLFVQYYPQ